MDDYGVQDVIPAKTGTRYQEGLEVLWRHELRSNGHCR